MNGRQVHSELNRSAIPIGLMQAPINHQVGRRVKYQAPTHITRGLLSGAVVCGLALASCGNAGDQAIDLPSDTTVEALSDKENASSVNVSATDGDRPADGPSSSTTILTEIPPIEEELLIEVTENEDGEVVVELPKVELPDLAPPLTRVEEIEDQIEDQAAEQEVLEVLAKPAENKPDPIPAVRDDGHQRNEAGNLVSLDEAAGLACADIEIGLTALDEGDTSKANTRVQSAASRAGESQTSGFAEWSTALAAVDLADDGLPTLVGFLSVCADGGYEL